MSTIQSSNGGTHGHTLKNEYDDNADDSKLMRIA